MRTPEGIAISVQKQSVLPLSQQALFVLISIAYHPYEGVALNHEEKKRLRQDLGDKTHLILPNHGMLTVGRTIPDAFPSICNLQRAARFSPWRKVR